MSSSVIKGQYYTQEQVLAGSEPNAVSQGDLFPTLTSTKSGSLYTNISNGTAGGMLFPWAGKSSTTLSGTDGSITKTGTGASTVATMTSATMQFSSVCVGQSITITDGTVTGNSGTFTITAWTSSSISWVNATAGVSTGVTWSYAGNYVISEASIQKFGATKAVDKYWTACIVSPGGGQVSVNWRDGGSDIFTLIAGLPYAVAIKQINATSTTTYDLQIWV